MNRLLVRCSACWGSSAGYYESRWIAETVQIDVILLNGAIQMTGGIWKTGGIPTTCWNDTKTLTDASRAMPCLSPYWGVKG